MDHGVSARKSAHHSGSFQLLSKSWVQPHGSGKGSDGQSPKLLPSLELRQQDATLSSRILETGSSRILPFLVLIFMWSVGSLLKELCEDLQARQAWYTNCQAIRSPPRLGLCRRMLVQKVLSKWALRGCSSRNRVSNTFFYDSAHKNERQKQHVHSSRALASFQLLH